jgi:hypothetical protein
MTPSTFRSKLVRPEGVGTWTFAPVPKAISEKERLRSHQCVKGTVDGVVFGSSLMPRGKGLLFLVVNGSLREQIRKRAGDTVEVRMELDASPSPIVVPPALQHALSKDPVARRQFEALAPSHRKAFSQWVANAKREETRSRRITQSVEMLHRGETPN